MKVKALSACALLATAAAGFTLACSPTYAPPARATHYGAPPVLERGRYEVAGTVLGEDAPKGGGGSLGYALNDHLQIEAGADGFSDRFAMGYAGVRYAPLSGLGPKRRARLTFDAEGGIAIGLGGENCSRKNADGEPICDSLSWDERLAGGGYAGAAVGLNASWFDLYLRGRAQWTYADHAPETLWLSGLFGVQASILKAAKLYLAAGHYWYFNEWDSENGTIWEAGLSVMFRGK